MERPISPHLQIYKPQITWMMSMFHRISGLVNIAGLVLISAPFVAVAYGRDVFEGTAALMTSWFGLLVLGVFSLSMCYHLCNGVRHLLWDTGRGLDIATVRKSGVIALIVAAVLFLAIWI